MTARSLLLAGAAVLGVALVAPTAAPLYDGIGFPDEPYRYVLRPPGDSRETRPPSSVTMTATAAYGLNNEAVVGNCEEQSPQLGFYLPRGGLATSMSPQSVEVRAVPLAPTVQPLNGVVTGNAYAITATSQGGPVTTTAVAVNGVVMMRSDLGTGFTFEYQPQGSSVLQPLVTQQVSGDRFQTRFAGLGTYSLARLATPKVPAGSGLPYLPIGLGAVLVALLAGVVVAVRRSRQSAPTG